MNKDGSGHTGFVYAVDKEKNIVYTIEGNSADGVRFNSRKMDSYFDGFVETSGNLNLEIPMEEDLKPEKSEKDR